ncbi:MAG: hypothetical protein C4294_11705 [Nitrospiraceae bacterium]
MAAVEEGRGIFSNIRKVIHYLLSCNVSEILVMLLAALLGLPLPLLPVQILWINLVTDGLPALALAVDPTGRDLMKRPPRPPGAGILERDRLFLIFGQGLFIAVITGLAFVYCLYSMEQDLERARSVTFMVLVLAQLVHAFNVRSDWQSLWEIGFWTNRALVGATVLSGGLTALLFFWSPLREIFALGLFYREHWLTAFVMGVLPLPAVELWKAARRAGLAEESEEPSTGKRVDRS